MYGVNTIARLRMTLPPSEEHPQKQEMQMFASLQEFEKATGHIPYRLNASDVAYETSKYQKTRQNEEWLYTYYTYGDAMIVTTQMWNIVSDISALTNDSYQLYTTSIGNEVYYSTDKIDGSVYALTQLGDSILMVNADSIVPLERILQIFEWYGLYKQTDLFSSKVGYALLLIATSSYEWVGKA